MSGKPTDSESTRRSRAEAVLAEHLAGLREGEKLDIDALCAEHPDLAGEIRRAYGDHETRLLRPNGASEDAGPGISLDEPPGKPGDTPSGRLLERLKAHTPKESRYEMLGEVARGGMGAIVKIWDADLRRTLAMKVVLGKAPSTEEGSTPSVDSETLARFLEEAQLTGQLDHPGIIPVHELGLDSDGRVYFTMRLVKGRDLREILDLVRDGKEGWNQTRALGVLLKACEAMAYAHAKGVIHRDLKPANVMVGRFGEVYVMDWGLARVMGREDRKDIRLRVAEGLSSGRVKTVRDEEGEATPDSPLETMDGDVVGTPAYMAPEQARGEVSLVGPRSDVYAFGAMLYHVLAGETPYVARGENTTPVATLAKVVKGPPKPPRKLNPEVPAELEAICEKAMARDPSARYPDVLALAEDLRAYMEGRVVRAHRTGAGAELKKWVQRNRGWAATVAVAVALLVFFVLGSTTAALVVSAKNKLISAARNEAQHSLELAEGSRKETEAALTQVSGARDEAQHNYELAEESRSLAEQAQQLAQHSSELAEKRRKETEAALASARWQAYVANLAGAAGSVEQGDTGEARRRLDFCPPEYRAWEWRHLNLKLDPSLAVMRGHTDRVIAVAFDSDGRGALSVSLDATVRLWEAETGKILTTHRAYEGTISKAALSADGKRLAVVADDHSIRVLDSHTGAVRATLRGHAPEFTSVAFSPDGRWVAAGSTDNTIWIWKEESGEEVATFRGHTGPVWSVAFSSDGKRLASGSYDNTVLVRVVETGDTVATLVGHESGIVSLAFSPDGKRLASGSYDNTVRVWDPETGEPLATLRGHGGRVNSVVFSPDGKHVVSGSYDSTVRSWDPDTGEPIGVLRGHEGGVNALAFSSDGIRLVSGSDDRTLRIWNSETSDAALSLRRYGNGIDAVVFSPDGKRILSGDWDKRVLIWDAEAGDVVFSARGPEGRGPICFSRDAKRAASSTAESSIIVWDAQTGEPITTLEGHTDMVHAVAFSLDGKRLASGSNDETIMIWDLGKSIPLVTLRGHAGTVTALAFSPDGERLVSGAGDRSVRVWDARSGEPLGTFEGHGGWINAVAFSPDGRRIASGSVCYSTVCDDNSIRLWDAKSGAILLTLQRPESPVNPLAFSPDGKRIVSSYGGVPGSKKSGAVQIWNTEGGELLATLRGHEKEITAIAFSPDGKRIVSGSADHSVIIWESEVSTARKVWHGIALQSQLERLVDKLFEKHLLVVTVEAALRADPSLEPEYLQTALRMARAHGEPSAQELNNATWEIVRRPDFSERDYEEALQWAAVACSERSDDPTMLNTLGAAQYRAGRFEKSLATFARADRLNRESKTPHSRVTDLVFIAMAHYQLGHVQEAKVALAEASSLLSNEVDVLILALFHEAESLIDEHPGGDAGDSPRRP